MSTETPEQMFAVDLQERLEGLSLTNNTDKLDGKPVMLSDSSTVIDGADTTYWNGVGAPPQLQCMGPEQLRDAAVIESIKGIYRLWSSGVSSSEEPAPYTQFLDLVHKAMDEGEP